MPAILIIIQNGRHQQYEDDVVLKEKQWSLTEIGFKNYFKVHATQVVYTSINFRKMKFIP